MNSRLPILLFFILLFGCLERTDVFPAEKEKVKVFRSGDSDGDRVMDQFYVEYAPFEIAPNTSVQRTITIKGILRPPQYLINLTDIFAVNGSGVEEARFLVRDFGKARALLTAEGPVEEICREKAGVLNASCADRDSCFRACSSPLCARIPTRRTAQPSLTA